MLREASAALLGAFMLAAGLVDCWADPASEGTPQPTAPISAQQRELARTIAHDALFDDADMPPGLVPRAIGVEEAHPATLQDYLDDGWIMFASNAWIDGTGDVHLVQQSVYVFEDQSQAAALVEELAADMAAIPGATRIPNLAESAVGYQRTFTRPGENERRTIEMAVAVGRLVINLDRELDATGTDWEEAAQAMSSTAVARANEALTAAGE